MTMSTAEGLFGVALAFATTYLLTLALERMLNAHGMTVPDYHRPGRPGVPRPGGPAIVVGAITGMALLFPARIAVAGSAALAVSFLIGLADDLFKFGGIEKPLLGLLTAVPVLMLHAYNPFPYIPFVGRVSITYLYPLLLIVGFTIYQNAANMLDIYNGLVTGSTVIAMVPLIVAALLYGETSQAYMGLVFLFVLLAFFLRHKSPARIFPGDSGSLLMGAMFVYLMVVSRAEVIGIIASLPMIFNGFFILSSIRGFREHSDLERPVEVLDDYRIVARKGKGMPVTLARIMASERPLTERQIVNRIWALFVFTDALALITLVLIK